MKFKKLTTTFITLAVIATSFPGIFYPEKVEAVAGVLDVTLTTEVSPVGIAGFLADAETAVTSALTSGSVAASLGQSFLEWAESFALSVLKRQILDVMVDQIVNWIQNGGEPRFITDWDKFFADVGQGAVGEFVQHIGAGFLCAPFSLQVRIGLMPVEKFGRNSPYSCTLDQIVGNVENFYKDFRNGGWIAYEEAGKLQNNYYGSLWQAWYGRDQFVASKLAAANAKVSANKGFLSVQLCRDKKTGLKISEEEIAKRNNDPDAYSPIGGTASNHTTISSAGDYVCEDTTPGGFVGATLEKAAGVDFDFIVNAQQLGDYAAAITNALVNRMIKEGVNGLRGVTGGQKQTGDTPAYYRTQDLPANIRNSGDEYGSGKFAVAQASLRNQISGAINNRKAVNSNYAILMDRAKTLLANLNTLKACLVGPLQIAVTTQNEIDLQNISITAIQQTIDENASEISKLESALVEVNSESDLEFSSASLAQMTTDVNAAAELRNETSSLVANSGDSFDARNATILADQATHCKK